MARLLILALLFGCGACASDESARVPVESVSAAGARAFVPGEYVVTVKPGEGADAVAEVYAAHGVSKLDDLGRGRFLVRLARDPGLEAARRAAAASGKVTAVERNFVYRYQQ